MRFILACDLKGGTVVRGVRGDRLNYRPIAETSRIVTTSEPLGVIEQIKPKETYIADLDKIMGTGDNALVIASMSRLTRTMADVGVKSASDASIGAQGLKLRNTGYGDGFSRCDKKKPGKELHRQPGYEKWER